MLNHHIRRWGAWLCASVCLAASAADAVELGAQQLIDVLDGVPRHHIRVPTLADADAAIRIDGVVDEAAWRQVPDYDNMQVAVPGTGEPGAYRTELRLLATDRALYVSAVMHQPPDTLMQRLSARDEFIDRDLLGFTIDPGSQGHFAYWFMVALGGSVLDGKALPERRFQNDWDGPWHSATARLSHGWSAEMMLPWSMMGLPRTQGERTMGFAFSRYVAHAGQRYQWPGHTYSSARFVTALNAMQVAGIEPRPQISIIPFASMTRDQARGEEKARAGVDLAWRPSPNLSLAATALPDFGAVEADDVVLNLTGLETFFPEKRLFFLEGNEVFESTPRANFGNIARAVTNDNFSTTSRKVWRNEFLPVPISLANTRRMGGTATQVEVPDEVELRRGERGLPTDLLGAAKVTGAAGNLRYGLMGALEDDVEWLGEIGTERVKVAAPGRDFAVARLLYEAVGADRRSVGYIGTLVAGPMHDAEVHGIDAHYTSSDGGVVADAHVMRSLVDGEVGYGAYRVRQRWWGDVQVATDAGKALSFSASLGALQENLGDWTCALAAGTTWRPNDRLSLDFDLNYKRRRGWVVHAEERSFGT